MAEGEIMVFAKEYADKIIKHKMAVHDTFNKEQAFAELSQAFIEGADLKALSGCTHIAMLDGWEGSNGAKREKAEAERIGIEIMFFREIGGLK